MVMVHELATAPVQGAERMDVLDAVRGVAVLGILLANVIALSGLGFVDPDHAQRLPLAEWHAPIWFGVLFLIEAKFYSLFSFLFGVGFGVFALQIALSRMWLAYGAFGPVEWLWRMFTYRRSVRLWR